MGHKALSNEVVSLIHHIELNESGWWKKAIGQIIKGLLWRASTSMNFDEIQKLITSEIGYEIESSLLRKQIESLCSQKDIVKIGDEKYKLSEAEHENLTNDFKIAHDQQIEFKNLFIQDIEKYCHGLDPQLTWESFSKVLENVISNYGANAYQILVGERIAKESNLIERFIEENSNYRIGLSTTIDNIFDPRRQCCRSQILRIMSASFFAESCQLNQKTLALIEKKINKKSIKIVLDTNMIFSILNLHNNPANDQATSILKIAKDNKNVIEIKFYVLPGTIDEAVSTLTHQLDKIKQIRINQAIANAANNYPFSGIISRYFEIASKSPNITPESFFKPYIDNLQIILKEIGVLILEEQSDRWRTNQKVIDDVLTETKSEEKHPEEKRKNYNTILHDMIFWNVIKSRRSQNITSPLDIDIWGVTADWRLIDFDSKKRSDSDRFPILLYPTNLIQLLQFWIPRSESLETNLINSVSLPLFFSKFDSIDENATLKILGTLSRYENLEDIPESAVASLLANQALKTRLLNEVKNNDAYLVLIKEELLKQLNESQAREFEAKKNLELLSKSNIENEKIISKTTEVLREKTQDHIHLMNNLSNVKHELAKANENLSLEKDSLSALKNRHELIIYLIVVLFSIIISLIISFTIISEIEIIPKIAGNITSFLIISYFLFLLFHLIIEKYSIVKNIFINVIPFIKIKDSKSFLWGVLFFGFIIGTLASLSANNIQKNVDVLKSNEPKDEKNNSIHEVINPPSNISSAKPSNKSTLKTSQKNN